MVVEGRSTSTLWCLHCGVKLTIVVLLSYRLALRCTYDQSMDIQVFTYSRSKWALITVAAGTVKKYIHQLQRRGSKPICILSSSAHLASSSIRDLKAGRLTHYWRWWGGHIMSWDTESLLGGSEKVTGGAEFLNHCWDSGAGLADFGGAAVNVWACFYSSLLLFKAYILHLLTSLLCPNKLWYGYSIQ